MAGMQQHHRANLRTEWRDIGDGLVLRQASRDDIDEVAWFNGKVHYAPHDSKFEKQEVHTGIAYLTHDRTRGAGA